MKASIVKRLEELEALYRDDPLIVLASTDSGEDVKIPLRELLASEGGLLRFKKVIGGRSIKDLEALLNAQREEAIREYEALEGKEGLEGEEDLETLFLEQREELIKSREI